MSAYLVNLIQSFGLAGILITMAGESAGLPISSEIVVPLGGYLSASGKLSFWGVVIAATIGNLLGSLIAFWLTRRYGEAVIVKHGKKVGINVHHLEMARKFFNRFGLAAVFIGRLLPVIRTYISFPAGLSKMGYLSFSAFTLAGALPWNLGLAYAGLKFGQNYHRIGQYLLPVTIVVALIIVGVMVWLYRAGRRAEALATA